jgi:hypothetical protein
MSLITLCWRGRDEELKIKVIDIFRVLFDDDDDDDDEYDGHCSKPMVMDGVGRFTK